MKNNNWIKWGILAILALVWGTSFILIKRSVHFINPYTVGALRVFLAGIFLIPFGIYHLKKIPKKTYKWILLTGLLGNFIPMFLFPLAEEKLSSSVSGILNSLVPVFVIVIGILFFHTKSTKRQIAGAIIGFTGALLLILSSQIDSTTLSLEDSFLYASLIVLATIMYACSALIIKKYLSEIPSFQLSSVLFGIYTIPSFLILVFMQYKEPFLGTENFESGIVYVVLLGVLGTALANMLFYKLIQMSSTVFASSVTYLMPIIALFWGILDGERIGFQHVLGMLIILFGVYLIKEKSSK